MEYNMIDIYTLGLCFAILLIMIIMFSKNSHRNLPPGPMAIPFIGNAVLFKEKAHEKLTEMGLKYGNIFRIYFGSSLVVVLNDYKAIKEAFVNQAETYQGRPSTFVFYWFHEDGGMAFTNGKIWKDQRRFSLHTLRDFGFGKASLENRIMVEVQNCIDIMASHKGKPFFFNRLLDRAVSNVVCSLVYDKRFDFEDKEFDKLLSNLETLFAYFRLLSPINFFPFIRFLSKEFKTFAKAVYDNRVFHNSNIDEHLATFDPEFPRDFIDVYIKRMKEEEEKYITETTFTRDNLLKVIENLFMAGTETTSLTMVWGILYMIHYPNIQRKIQEELDHNVGARSVSLSDRNNLPYTEAALMEMQRLANLVPLSISHMTEKDSTIFNYFIPRGTIIIPNLWAAHLDPKYWPNPNEFKPERFLDEHGNICKNSESFVPFSIGKRICPAESLAKNELFLFMGNFLQRFNFILSKGDPLPDVNNYIDGLTIRPPPFKVCAELRQ